MSTKPCPDCRLPIKATATRCACGWKTAESVPQQRHASTDPLRDPICTYELLGKRCPNPWVIARGGRRYCREHDPRASAATELAHITGGVGDFNALRAKINAAPPMKRVGAATPIGDLARANAPVQPQAGRFDTFEDDIPWEAGRE